MVGTLEVIVQEASKVKIILPNVSALKDALFKAKDWTSKVERVHVCVLFLWSINGIQRKS